MKISLLPLDERPVCTRLVRDVAATIGVTVQLPPAGLLPSKRQPGDPDRLAEWLAAEQSDAAIVSLEMLGFGGLIPSRIGAEDPETALRRWSVLSSLDRPVSAFTLIPRIPDADDGDEEPDYWAQHGRRLHAFSDRVSAGSDRSAAARSLSAQGVPAAVLDDWLGRRLRQQIVALEAVRLAHIGVIDNLVVGIDDARPGSLSSSDAAAVGRWTALLGLANRVTVQPGADEIAVALLARTVAQGEGAPIRVLLRCAEPAGLDAVAPYETGPVGDTARLQLRAAGAELVAEGEPADAVLVVHAPHRGDWAVSPPHPDAETARRAAATAHLVRQSLEAGVPVGVADVGAPNGCDPELVSALGADLLRLDGFAGWNTAGNALGTVSAHLVCAVAGERNGRRVPDAWRAELARRVIEDFAYQSRVRPALRARRGAPADAHDRVEAAEMLSVAQEVGLGLQAEIARLPFTGVGIAAESVRFPWERTFEVDFDLEVGIR